jgi:hypothetical protein
VQYLGLKQVPFLIDRLMGNTAKLVPYVFMFGGRWRAVVGLNGGM